MKIVRGEKSLVLRAPIIVVNNEEEAVAEANNSEFGLGASIWTNNLERGMKISKTNSEWYRIN